MGMVDPTWAEVLAHRMVFFFFFFSSITAAKAPVAKESNLFFFRRSGCCHQNVTNCFPGTRELQPQLQRHNLTALCLVKDDLYEVTPPRRFSAAQLRKAWRAQSVRTL
jgi:hypothetical protein